MLLKPRAWVRLLLLGTPRTPLPLISSLFQGDLLSQALGTVPTPCLSFPSSGRALAVGADPSHFPGMFKAPSPALGSAPAAVGAPLVLLHPCLAMDDQDFGSLWDPPGAVPALSGRGSPGFWEEDSCGILTAAVPALPGRGSPGFWDEDPCGTPASLPSPRTAQGAPCQGCGTNPTGFTLPAALDAVTAPVVGWGPHSSCPIPNRTPASGGHSEPPQGCSVPSQEHPHFEASLRWPLRATSCHLLGALASPVAPSSSRDLKEPTQHLPSPEEAQPSSIPSFPTSPYIPLHFLPLPFHPLFLLFLFFFF